MPTHGETGSNKHMHTEGGVGENTLKPTAILLLDGLDDWEIDAVKTVEPDNPPYVSSMNDGNCITVTFKGKSPGSLLLSLDDYLANIQVALRTWEVLDG